ncbi:LysR substrate binding domain protein [Synechococcus sp. PCC 7335]|uniref:LysR substrate-binding domain-containing protein n=1 Tax=Synechococcus sp. (strain ATCC 29403 / PCC 7335) TaxID=91464 RepID=UPI00017ED602|nr:LysR substrate-binding domain-containing protein [Synechococcus sp. PCC 7335]EDX84976.1 LysR substrate binding domain protein [Synechococcus sp. PCC 7335]
MEIYQIKVFLEVARHLSFTEAADALNLTQPAVSAKIKSLESSLGASLFHRLGRKITLTPVGEYLVKNSPELIQLESRLVKEIDQIKQGKSSRLKIGCTTNVANGWLPKILFSYRQKYPTAEVQCFPFDTIQSLHQAITSADVDVGFSETNLQGFDEVASLAVDNFQYLLMVAADHRLARREWLGLKELTTEAWVFPADGTPERLALNARLAELGMDISDFPHREIVCSSSLMSMFLKQGHYLGFASSLQLQAEQQAKLIVSVPLKEFPLDYQLFMLVHKSQAKAVEVTQSDLKSLSRNPVRQLIQLVYKQTNRTLLDNRLAHQNQTSQTKEIAPADSSSLPSALPTQATAPVYLRSPSLQIRPKSTASSQVITITIGTQNKTIQTVTAGLIIKNLGLLEHFLPHEGRYKSVEYRIKWQDFTSGAPIVSGLQSQQLDIGVIGDYPLLLSGVTPTDSSLTKTRLVSFVASNPDGAGNTIIVPNRSELNSLDDLRSRVIAVPFASSAHGMVMRRLSRANLLADVTLTSIEDLNIHSLTPRNNQADGYAYFAPLHDIASHQGKFRRLQESDHSKLPTFHGIVVQDEFAEQHPDLVIAYLKSLIAAQYWYMTTPSALCLASNWVGLDAEIVAKTLGHKRSSALGLFFPETQIRTDWIAAHVQQLSTIKGNEALGNLDLETWIQPDLLEMALSSV